ALPISARGIGSVSDLAAVLLAQRAGVEFNHVRYGTATLIPDLIGGHIDFTFEVIGTAIPMVQAGEVKALAITGPSRHPLLPDVQTFGESVPGYSVQSWFAVAGPAGMTPEVAGKFHDTLDQVLRSEKFTEFLNTRGYSSLTMSPTEMHTRALAELSMWGDVISQMKPE